MKRVFKTRHFTRWMRKTELTDAALCAAVNEMAQGLVDADLGGHVLKKRVALPGRGKSGSARTLVATNKGSRWFFVFGFEKSERANITAPELEALRLLAESLLALTAQDLDAQVSRASLEEICHDHPREGQGHQPPAGGRP
ncbi:MAG: type II toxin-antitoxin system RelE/ParE family toxin [Pseudomonadota bacterium]